MEIQAADVDANQFSESFFANVSFVDAMAMINRTTANNSNGHPSREWPRPPADIIMATY